MVSIRKVRRLARATLVEWQACDVSLLASALAYSTVFALAPLMILVIMMLGAIFGEATARAQIVTQMTDSIGADGAELLATAITNLRAQTGESPLQLAMNLGFFVVGASSIFAQIQQALDRIWEVQPAPGRQIAHFLRKRLLSFTMILAIVFLLLVAAISNSLLAVIVSTLDRWLPGLGSLWLMLRWLISFNLIIMVFAAMYTILPDIEIHWRNTLMGATIAALLFIAGQALFGVFLSMANIGSGYGVAGSFLIIITWIFYAAQVLFSGAVFTKVYARQRGVPIVPSEFAVSTSTTNLR